MGHLAPRTLLCLRSYHLRIWYHPLPLSWVERHTTAITHRFMTWLAEH
jgi:hypothetical protein